MGEFKNVGNHTEDLADGRMLAPGEVAEVDEEAVEDPRNADLIERGILIALEGGGINATEAAEEFAAEKGIELTTVTGTGAGGQIIKADVERHAREGEEG